MISPVGCPTKFSEKSEAQASSTIYKMVNQRRIPFIKAGEAWNTASGSLHEWNK
jgi:hypothetical protein